MRNPLQATKAWQAWHGRHGPNPSKSGRGWGVATVRPWLPGSKQGRNEICAARQKNFRQKAKKREKGKEKRIKGTLPGRNETRRRRACRQDRPCSGRRRAGTWESRPKPPRATPARLRFRSLSGYDQAILRSSRTGLPPTPTHSLPCRRSLPVSLPSETIPPESHGPLSPPHNSHARYLVLPSPKGISFPPARAPLAPTPPPWAAVLPSRHSTRPPHTSLRLPRAGSDGAIVRPNPPARWSCRNLQHSTSARCCNRRLLQTSGILPPSRGTARSGKRRGTPRAPVTHSQMLRSRN